MSAHRHSSAVLSWAAIFFVHTLIVFAILLAFTGCATVTHRSKSPAGESQAGDVKVTQTGDAAVPAASWSVTDTASVPLPAGSEITFNEKLGTLSVKLSGETILTTTTRSDHATGPQAFTPPAPPSPSDQAKGKAVLWLRLGLVAGIAVGAFGLVKGWDLLGIGGGCIASACFFGLSLEAIPVWLWTVFGIGGALAVVGPSLWHLKLKKLPSA